MRASKTMPYSISYDPQAEAALSTLQLDERNRVLKSVRGLAESGPSGPSVHRLASGVGGGPAYSLNAGAKLRVLFTTTGDAIIVLDVLNYDLVARYG